MIAAETERPLLMRELLGESLRELRNADQRTLREVSSSARVSLGYLSEIERGQKEPSSELLNAICGALGVPLSLVLRRVSDKFDDRDVVAHLAMRSARVAA
jgi:transcriptional regulator with XRE-family HTH domain